MAMNKYSDIEIQTAKNMLKNGYKWIARDESGSLFAYTDKPRKWGKLWWSDGRIGCVCEEFVPIFQSVRFGDDPVSLESIVHPQILDDAEQQYLSTVIKPFRDMVMHLRKSDKFIAIFFKYKSGNNQWSNDAVYLPYFGTMYKGMQRYKKYTLEDLGL